MVYIPTTILIIEVTITYLEPYSSEDLCSNRMVILGAQWGELGTLGSSTDICEFTTIVQSYTVKYHEFVAVCIVTT